MIDPWDARLHLWTAMRLKCPYSSFEEDLVKCSQGPPRPAEQSKPCAAR